jgi:hypothetical protein
MSPAERPGRWTCALAEDGSSGKRFGGRLPQGAAHRIKCLTPVKLVIRLTILSRTTPLPVGTGGYSGDHGREKTPQRRGILRRQLPAHHDERVQPRLDRQPASGAQQGRVAGEAATETGPVASALPRPGLRRVYGHRRSLHHEVDAESRDQAQIRGGGRRDVRRQLPGPDPDLVPMRLQVGDGHPE